MAATWGPRRGTYHPPRPKTGQCAFDGRPEQADGWGHKVCSKPATTIFHLADGSTTQRCDTHAVVLRRALRSFPGWVEEPVDSPGRVPGTQPPST